MKALLPLLFCLATATPAWALSPSWKFATLRSEHFDVIYREEQKDIARVYSEASERAHQLLLPLFREAPTRTVVVLRDDTDIANGMATFLPYPLIVINPVPPLASESISDYGDWALEIMIHEYTHILNMHPVHGWIRPLQYVFGTVIKPNALLPRWYLEGLAVNTESRLTPFGRLRSAEDGGSLRAAVEGKILPKESIDRVNESAIPTWPLGTRPYLFGSVWWAEAFSANPKAFFELNQDFSQRLPFFLNRPLKTRLGASAQDLLNQSYKRVESRAHEHFAAIEKAGGEGGQSLSGDPAADLSLPVLSPDGLTLAYLARNVGLAAQIRLAHRTSLTEAFDLKKSRTLARSSGTTRLAWAPDGQALVFDQIDIESPFTNFRDLYRQPLAGKSERLTRGLRAQEPAFSPDGKQVAFIQTEAGRTSLGLLDLTSRQSRVLLKAPIQERLAQPIFWNDQLFLLWRSTDGRDRLVSVDPSTGVSSDTDVNLQNLFFLNRSSKGLLLGSAETGAANIYLWDRKVVRPITNTLTSIGGATWDEGRSEWIVSRLTAEGNRLRTLAFATTQPPTLTPFFDVPAAPEPPLVKTAPEERSYQPWRYLAPHYWVPFIYPVEKGVLFQGQTYNMDPVGRNEYSLLGSYDSVTRKGGFGFDYANSSTPATLDLSYSRFQNYLGASGITLENQRARIGAGFFLFPHSKFWRANVSGLWTQIEGTETVRRLGPGVGLHYSRLENPFSNRGYAFSVNHREFIPQGQNLHYGSSSAALEFRTGTGATSSHHFVLNMKAALAPRLPFHQVVDLGERSLGANYLISLAGGDYLLRGYPSGTFVGRKVLNANLEYQIPLKGYWSGWGTMPLFLRDLEGAAFFDTMAVDGGAYRMDRNPEARGYYRTHLREFYSGTGIEIRLNTTAAYHLPLTITMGLYYGLKNEYSGGFTQFLGITYEGLSALGH